MLACTRHFAIVILGTTSIGAARQSFAELEPDAAQLLRAAGQVA
jgi:hypothetical protein